MRFKTFRTPAVCDTCRFHGSFNDVCSSTTKHLIKKKWRCAVSADRDTDRQRVGNVFERVGGGLFVGGLLTDDGQDRTGLDWIGLDWTNRHRFPHLPVLKLLRVGELPRGLTSNLFLCLSPMHDVHRLRNFFFSHIRPRSSRVKMLQPSSTFTSPGDKGSNVS